MELQWMGQYREIVRSLIRYANLYAHFQTDKRTGGVDIPLSAQEWQTLECIFEFEDSMYNMAGLARKIGIPASNFSKYVKTLTSLGLVERYRLAGNRKSIILKLSQKGRDLYEKRSQLILKEWEPIFSILETIPPEELALFTEFIVKFSDIMDTSVCDRPILQKIEP